MPEPVAKSAVKFTSVSPQFIVSDVVAAAEYYRDVLGFRILGYFLDPPVFATVARDTVAIHFGKADNGAPPTPNVVRRGIATDAYIWVNDLDALHAELKAAARKSSWPRSCASISATKWWSKTILAFACAFRWTPAVLRPEKFQRAQ